MQGQPLGVPKGLIAPLSRGNSRGGGLGGSLGGYNNNSVGGGFAFGALRVPPPPPTSRHRDPPKQIELKKEKLLESNPNAWKPNRIKQRVPGAAAQDEEPKSEEDIVIEVCRFCSDC